MRQFVQSMMLLILITALSVPTSPYPYVYIMSAGLLMVLFGAKSVSEKYGIEFFALMAVLLAVFAYCSGNFFAFLIFHEYRIGKAGKLRILFPAVIYGAFSAVIWELTLPQVLFRVIALSFFSLLLHIIELLADTYLFSVEKAARAVRVTAVNEMYEKKLNHELVLKNYLADRNARLEERENISRNIHNSVGHSITAAIMTLDAADMLFDSAPEKAREKMNTANERIRASLNTIRYAVRVLDTGNEYIEMADFIREITAIADNFIMDTHRRVLMDFSRINDAAVILREHAEFLTGAVQEFLTNGVRHGCAQMFTIIGTADSAHMQISVEDNGSSDFSPQNSSERIKNGFGLKKIASYVKRCGGTVTFENEHGFRSVIVLPLYNQNADNEVE